jgi:hypothetical protein
VDLFKNPRVRTKLQVSCALLGHVEDWNHDSVRSWGAYSEVEQSFVLVDDVFLAAHPAIMESLRARKAPRKALKKIAKKIVRRVIRARGAKKGGKE